MSLDVTSLSREELENEVLRLRGETVVARALASREAEPALDADDRGSLEEAMLRSRARYRALFEAIDDGFCIIEFIDGPHGPLSDYVHIEANSGYGRHTGIHDIVGKRLRDIEPTAADKWLKIYGDVLRDGVPIRFELQFEAVSRYIEVSATRMEPKELRQVSVLFRDITERKTAEAALRASEAVARANIERVQLALAAGAIIGTWFWNLPDDRFEFDEGFARAFDLDPALSHSKIGFDEIVASVHPQDLPGLRAAMDQALARGGPYVQQYRARRADGKYYWLEANGRVELGPDGKALSFPGVLLDIEARRTIESERDRAAAALRALNDTLEQRVAERTAELMHAEEQLRHAQKMEAVGQLTGGIAHDFNNLLAGISGSLELMQTRLAQGRIGDLDRYLTGAQGAAKRAAGLTQRLLAFSRRQTLDPKPTVLNRLVSDMQDLITRSVGPTIAVETALAGGLWSSHVDIGQLENALLNLSINARDAMPDGGKLTIETANRWFDDRAARQRNLPPGQYVSLCVSDTGTGMTPDVVERAFDPFFTTKPTGQGTGLGLSMVHGFAGQSGGTARIYSELGKGTMICIYLPRHLGEAQAEEQVEEEAANLAPAAEHETILVVDDEPLVRMVAVEILDELGYTVLEAEDAAAALKILKSGQRIDLLVTDVGLPGGMNGRQLADAVRVERPELRILFVTGYAENAVLNHGHLDHGMHVMTKPFLGEELARKVRELLAD
ncbi:hybrid sensor histidine kinase/response regulator [Rhizobium halophytocola]|uniref:histidine kinase n=1 Tax=Rhizobium halophytocola TaxID=735519 RepID=A0ABS4E5U8_9HYPH|nr:hybrid sensor histidine kinase/response regulator [Rhizobium halophytocola]MBP1853323.1 signal transduction histidine kinase/CheY-like chemotaxis protein [Rhizobium halophytocola]